MAVDMFLKLDGCDGESADSEHADEIDVLAFSWGMTQSGSMHTGGGGGSGKVNAETFEINEFSASISGSGSVRITAKEELDVRISGSGKVYYHGTPRVNSSSSGSGKTVAL